jgi:hypothetical protein
MSALFLLFALLSVTLGDVVLVNWKGTCSSNQGFGYTFISYNGGEAFKPDGKNGAMVPCDEYFEISFSFVDSTTGHVISFPAATTGIYSVLKTYNTNGVIVVQMTPEVSGWGNGYFTVGNPVDTVTNQPYTFVCTNGVGSVHFVTNYYLAATNNVIPPTSPNNYLRALDTVIDSGNWNVGNVTEPFPSFQGSMQLGLSVCNEAAETPITYPFPAFTTTVQTSASTSANNGKQTSASTSSNNVQQTSVSSSANNGQQTSASTANNGQQTSATNGQQTSDTNGQQTSANNGQPTSAYNLPSNLPTYFQPSQIKGEGFVVQASAMMIIFAIVLILL